MKKGLVRGAAPENHGTFENIALPCPTGTVGAKALEPFMPLRRVLPFLMAPFLMAGWDPLSPQVWAMKPNAGENLTGAVVLEESLAFKNTYIEFLYRVRILDETGKDAVQFSEFSDDSYDFEGRTVYPDGREVAFNKRKDLTTQTLAAGWDEARRKVVIPPGVTGNCVVEIRWKESAKPLPARMTNFGHWTQGGKYRTLLSVVSVPVNFPSSFQFFNSKATPTERIAKGSSIIWTTRDLPGDRGTFYTLSYVGNPRFAAYSQPPLLMDLARANKIPEYWNKAGRTVLKDLFLDETKLGSNYRALAKAVGEDLPPYPQARAVAVLKKLEARIRNLDSLTHAEASEKKREERTDSFGMLLLYVTLLKGEGVDPKLALVRNRNHGLFEYLFPCLYQMETILVGVDEPGKPTLWLNPQDRYAPPGVIEGDYQGTPSVFVDTRTWEAAKGSIPFQPMVVNRRDFEYRVEPDDEQCRFTLKATFAGLPAQRQRGEYLALAQARQDELLKNNLEAQTTAAKIATAKVLNATDPGQNVAWDATGTLPLEEGRRVQLTPFPCMPPPLWIPASFPANRKELILLPYNRTQTASCILKIPQGYRLTPTEDLRRANKFGHVAWSAEGREGSGEVKVAFQVDVELASTGPDSYEAFRNFLEWIDEAMKRPVMLEKL